MPASCTTASCRDSSRCAKHWQNDTPIFMTSDYSADEILITNGVTQASFATFMATVDEGDEVIVLDPYYPQHNSKISLAGGKVVPVPLRAVDGTYRLDAGAVEAAVTSATKMIVLINPSNPAGTVFTREELQQLADNRRASRSAGSFRRGIRIHNVR